MIKIEPYVTTNGGVVILNGPFPIKQAQRVAKLCKAAPELLDALKLYVERAEGCGAAVDRDAWHAAKAAIAKVEG